MTTTRKLSSKQATRGAGLQARPSSAEDLAAVGKLTARVAHELNNPLDGVLRYTNLAIRRVTDTGGDEQLLDYLSRARTAVMRMGEVMKDLLAFSRASPAAFEQATINRIVTDAVHTFEGRAREQSVEVVCRPAETDLTVARGSHLFQVFCNLVKNAIDAMPDGGRLEITVHVDDQRIVVRVADTGIGLPKDAERIFEPFFTTKPPGQGTGLGLAISRDLVERFGGTIETSPNSPQGTVMTVTLPVKNCAARAAKRDPSAPGSAGG